MTTLPQQYTIVQSTASGSSSQFPFAFYTTIDPTNDIPDIAVYLQPPNAQANPQTDILTYSTDYTVTFNGALPSSGYVTLLVTPAAGSIITIVRNISASLITNFSEARNFSGQNLDNILERLIFLIQQNKTYSEQRNLSYLINSDLPANPTEATQIPTLADNQVWKGLNGYVIAATLDDNQSTLRSDLARQDNGTDGSLLVGYYDPFTATGRTIHAGLTDFYSAVRLFGTDTGTTNAMVLTVANSTATYVPGMQVRIVPANTNTGATTINVNGLGVKNIYRDSTTPLAAGDLLINRAYSLIYDGTKFILEAGLQNIYPPTPLLVNWGMYETGNYLAAGIAPGYTINDTIPTKVNGAFLFSFSYTPQNTAYILEIDVTAIIGTNNSDILTVALFTDASDNAIAAAVMDKADAGFPTTVNFKHKMTAGTTSAITFSVYAGGNVSNSIYLNGIFNLGTPTRLFGGTAASSITVREYSA